MLIDTPPVKSPPIDVSPVQAIPVDTLSADRGVEVTAPPAVQKISPRQSSVDFRKSRPDDDLLIFSLTLSKILLLETLLTYEDLETERYYLPLADFVEALEFKIDVDNDRGRAQGWFISEKRGFSLDLVRAQAVVDGKEHSLSADDVEWHEDGIYVSIEMLEKWFPLTLDVDFSELAVVVKSIDPLPIEIRIARDEKRKKIASGKSTGRPKYKIEEVKSPLFNIPFVDTDMSFGYERASGVENPRSVNVTTRASGVFLGHDFDLNMNDSTINSEPPRIRAIFGLKDPNKDLFGIGGSEYNIGDVNASAIPLLTDGESGRGISFSTYALDNVQGAQSGTVRLRGDLLDGYQIDVVRNGQLLGFLEEPDENGEYIFDLDVLPGLNVFELIFYGPHGQKDVREERVFIPINAVEKGAFDFKTDIIQDETNLFTNRSSSNDEDVGKYRFSAQAEYGLSDLSSVYAAVSTLSRDGQREKYGLLRYSRSVKAVSTDFTYARSVQNQGQAFGFRMQTIFKGISARFQHDYFNNFISEETQSAGLQGELKHQTNLRLSGVLPVLNRIPFSLNVERLFNKDGVDRYNWDLRTTKNIKKLRITSEISQQIEDNVDRRTDLNLQFSSRFARLALRGNMLYALEPDRVLRTIGFNADWNYDKKSVFRAGFQRSGSDNPVQTYTFGYSHEFDLVRLGLNMSYNDQDDFRAFLNASFALGYDPSGGRLFMTQESLANSAVFVPHVYYDKNGNSVFDGEDEWMEDVKFSGPKFDRDAHTDKRGYVHLTGVEVYERTTLALDESSLPDPYLRSVEPPKDYILRPGQVVKKDFPVILVGEVDGDVYIVRRGKKVGAQSISIQIVDVDAGGVVQEGSSEFDGFYWIQDLPMGNYRARVNPDQLAELGYCEPLEQSVMLESEEPFYSLEPFVLWAKGAAVVTLAQGVSEEEGRLLWDKATHDLLTVFAGYENMPSPYLIKFENEKYDLVLRNTQPEQAQAICNAVDALGAQSGGLACHAMQDMTCSQSFVILPSILDSMEEEVAVESEAGFLVDQIKDLSETELEQLIGN